MLSPMFSIPGEAPGTASGLDTLAFSNHNSNYVHSATPIIDIGRKGSCQVHITAEPTDATLVRLVVATAGTTVSDIVYEFERAGGTTPGNIAVATGGSANQSIINLRTAINTNQGAALTLSSSGAILNIKSNTTNTSCTLSVNGGGVPAGGVSPYNFADQAAPAPRYIYQNNRLVTPGDVALGSISLDTGLTTINSIQYRFTRASVNIVCTAQVGAAGGVVTFQNAGATQFQANDSISLWVVGT